MNSEFLDPGIAWLPVLGGAAVFLDILLGDPSMLPHPVRLVGNVANSVEAFLRQMAKQAAKPKRQSAMRWAGGVGAALVIGLAATGAWALASMPTFGPLFALYLTYAGLALGALLREGRIVHRRLYKERDLLAARAALSMLVSRETRELDKQGVMRSLAETISENANDGFVAPFFWFTIGGIIGGSPAWAVAALWAFKAASTLDSMWGYKTKKWKDFGYVAARLDDILAWLPARLTALAMLLTALAERRVALGDLRALWRSISSEARTLASPNAGWPMSAAAWLACAWVGGPAVYFGKRKDKPVLGPEQNEWTEARMLTLFSLVRSSCIGIAAVMLALGFALLGVL